MGATGSPRVELGDVTRRFGPLLALDRVSLSVAEREVHALLGPNGAGKTTLLRVLTGVVAPTSGTARVGGIDVAGSPLAVRRLIGLVPSGDRTFYLRLSGLENLVFFARLRGHRLRPARARALRALESVGLSGAARQQVGTYSHGMQKRLSVARALLDDPQVLLVDEATHDLDPEGASDVRRLIRTAAAGGTAVLWTTQRVEEIRGFADNLTLLHRGCVRFQGTVSAFLERAPATRYVLGLRNGRGADLDRALRARLGAIASIVPYEGDQYLLALAAGAVLDDALRALMAEGVTVVSCRHEASEIEEAFLRLVRDEAS